MVTAHPIIIDKAGNPHVGPGRVALPSDEHKLAELLRGRSRASTVQIIPDNVLYQTPDAIAFWIKPDVRPMFVTDADGASSELLVQWPSLVAYVAGRRLYIAAAAGQTRPTATTPMYHAPVGNTYETSNVCLGNVRCPALCDLASIASWEQVITQSYFNHDNSDKVLAKKAKRKSRYASQSYTATDFWIERASHPPAPMEESLMTPLKRDLRGWIEAIEGMRND